MARQALLLVALRAEILLNAARDLLVLAPFVGEYLLGTIAPESASWAASFVPLVLLYGGGAVEVRRRLHG